MNNFGLPETLLLAKGLQWTVLLTLTGFAGGALGGLALKAWGPTGVFAATSALALVWLLLGWRQPVPAQARSAPPPAPDSPPHSPARQ